MYIHEVANFLEQHKNKTMEEACKISLTLHEDALFEEDKKLYGYLSKLLPRFFAFKQEATVCDKPIFEQLALFYESPLINNPYSAAVSWVFYFKAQLPSCDNPLNFAVLAENYFYAPNQFFGFLCYLISENVSSQSILNAHIVHRFFQYNYADESLVIQFLRLFEQVSDSKIKLFFEEMCRSEIMIRKNYALHFEQDQEKQWKFSLIKTETDTFSYDKAVFSPEHNYKLWISLYHLFQMDFINALNFSDKQTQQFFAVFLAQQLKTKDVNLNFDELRKSVFTNIPYQTVHSIMLALFDALTQNSFDDAQSSCFSGIIASSPAFIFVWMLGFIEYKQLNTELQIILAAPDFRQYILSNHIKMSSIDIQIILDCIKVNHRVNGGQVNSDLFFVLFDFIKKIALDKGIEGQSDSAIYGVSLKLLREIAKLPGVLQALTLYVKEMNEPLIERIKLGADFSTICAEWKLPAINVFKHICPELFSKPAFLGSINALKVVFLETLWLADVELSNGLLIDIPEVFFSLHYVFELVAPRNDGITTQLNAAEKIKILCDVLLDTHDKKLIDLCVDYLENTLHFNEWSKKILFNDAYSLAIVKQSNSVLLEKMKLGEKAFLHFFVLALKHDQCSLNFQSYCFEQIQLKNFDTVDLIGFLLLVLDKPNTRYKEKIFDFLEVDRDFVSDLIGGNSKKSIQDYSGRFLNSRAAEVLLTLLVVTQNGDVDDKADAIRYLCNSANNYEAIVFAFDKAAENNALKKTIISAIVDKQLKRDPRLFADQSLLWWNDHPCDAFFISCVFEILNRKYNGSRQSVLKDFCCYKNDWLLKAKTFLEDSRRTQQSSKLNNALSELVAQAEGAKAVSMIAIVDKLCPAKSIDEVRAFTL